MKKRFLCVISAIILIFAFSSIQSFAVDECSLSVVCKYDGQAISNANVNIYRIADCAFSDEVVLSNSFSDLNSEMDFTSTETADASAMTLYSYCVSNEIAPLVNSASNEGGTATFNNLEDGYYLVTIDKVTTEDWVYDFAPFIVALPETSTGNKEVTAYPKASRSEAVKYFDLNVMIVWDDVGFENERPESVIVDIYCDGVLYTSVELSEANNWQCVLTDLESNHEWIVCERNSDKKYSVDIEKPLENKFVIEYKIRDEKPTEEPAEEQPKEKLPHTGLYWWPAPVLAALGLVSVATGIVVKKKNEKE